mmetsp:Transcript_27497/g.53417  ORF Transcript_27497/g.53417 Transcript_27497/m.53417 type:complete len:211 (-) Transcript_27497:16-648(-)
MALSARVNSWCTVLPSAHLSAERTLPLTTPWYAYLFSRRASLFSSKIFAMVFFTSSAVTSTPTPQFFSNAAASKVAGPLVSSFNRAAICWFDLTLPLVMYGRILSMCLASSNFFTTVATLYRSTPTALSQPDPTPAKSMTALSFFATFGFAAASFALTGAIPILSKSAAVSLLSTMLPLVSARAHPCGFGWRYAREGAAAVPRIFTRTRR